jgi:hypothetical protein
MARWQVTIGLVGIAAAATLIAPKLAGHWPDLEIVPPEARPQTVPWVYSYPDQDGDGYGDPDAALVHAQDVPPGYVLDRTDCDDTRASVHPGALDRPGDGIDQDCDRRDAQPDQRLPLIPELDETPPPAPALPPDPPDLREFGVACGMG